MLRDTRVNLWLLLALFVLLAPGAVILFRAKLDPTARKLGQPDPVKQQRPYMDPVETPDQVERVAPPAVVGWVRAELTDRLGHEARELTRDTPHGRLPVISDTRRVQLVHADKTLVLLIWADAREATLDAFAPDAVKLDVVDVPAHVRAALQDDGYINPPPRVTWMTTPITQKPESLTVRFNGTQHVIRLTGTER